MSHPPNAHVGSVERLVPGKLVYVSTGQPKRPGLQGYPASIDSAGTYAFKPDKIMIEDAAGSFRPYRGEPFSEVGLGIGRRVLIVIDEQEDAHMLLLHDAPQEKEMSESAAREFVIKSFRFLKRK
jgi:hypothetical protein